MMEYDLRGGGFSFPGPFNFSPLHFDKGKYCNDIESLEEMEWGYTNARGIDIAPPHSLTDTALHYTDHRRKEKSEEKGGRGNNKRNRCKASIYSILPQLPEYEGNGNGPLDSQRNSCLGKP